MKLEATNQTVSLIIASCLDECNKLKLTQPEYLQLLHHKLQQRLNEPDLSFDDVKRFIKEVTLNDVDAHWENNAQAGEESTVGESDQTEQPKQLICEGYNHYAAAKLLQFKFNQALSQDQVLQFQRAVQLCIERMNTH